ncbi:MAG: tRNA1(Val) (adenine(37)-N6)-methyltransferase [Bacillota bacterium]
MESMEDIGFGGLKLLQSEDGFRFGIDAVLLADFACGICPSAGTVADLGTGNGAAAFIISHKIPGCSVTGIDLQAKAIDLARRSCEINGLQDRMTFIRCDAAELAEKMPELRGTADVVVSNPPYVAKGAGLVNDGDSRFISRQETTAGMDEFAEAAAFLLKDRGHFFLVHRPARLVDIFCFCRKHGLEPKDMRLVSPRKGAKPNIVLVHCVKGGGRELELLRDLYVYGEEGNYTPEILKIYEKTG